MTDDFSLRHLIREVLDTSDLTDPQDLAVEVQSRIRPSQYEEALSQLLPALVREMIRLSRNGNQVPPETPPPTKPAAPAPQPVLTLSRPAPAEQPAPKRAMAMVMSELPGGVAAPPRPVYRSAKVAAYQDLGMKWLSERLNTSQDPRAWKRLGDACFDDLMFAAGQRRDQAARTNAKAAEYEALAKLVRAYGVERVRDLPEDVLRGIKDMAA